jgi:hypothetical protein
MSFVARAYCLSGVCCLPVCITQVLGPPVFMCLSWTSAHCCQVLGLQLTHVLTAFTQ